jgi:hypothetical protein
MQQLSRRRLPQESEKLAGLEPQQGSVHSTELREVK